MGEDVDRSNASDGDGADEESQEEYGRERNARSYVRIEVVDDRKR